MPETDTVDTTSGERPLRRDAERNRRRILETARQVFAERGLDVSLDEIAQRADLGVGTVYRRFPTKEALVDALFEQQLEEVVAIGQEALADDDPWRGLVSFLERAGEMQSADRGLREVMLGTRYGHDRVARVRDGIHPIAAQLVDKARASGRLRADVSVTDIPLIAVMITAVADYAHDVRPEIWRRYITILIDGLVAARTGSTPLGVDPLTMDQVDEAMRAWHPHHR